ncbi:MAG TPA: MFS transporter [Gammaproteobacteria bacterium]|nr:MFS transporter [Gammaproteobacteria bacterium]
MNTKQTFCALCMGFFMVILDVTIVNVALPSIAIYFNITLSRLQWVVDGYTLTFAGFLLLVGSLSDYFGAKKIFQIGLLAFVLTSLGCALSQSLPWLIFFRLLQGISGALMLPSSLALITTLYKEAEKRAHAIGIWAALGGVACASGPFLGGLLTSLFSWRAIFLVNLLIGLISFFLISFNHSDIEKNSARVRFDFLGQITGFVAIFLLAYGLIQASVYGWTHPIILISFIISALSLVLFLFIEHQIKQPMLPLDIFHNKKTTMALIAAMILNLCFYGELFMIPFYFENFRHYSVFVTGLAILPLPGLALIGSYLGGKLTAKIGAAKIIFTGLFIAAIGFFALLTLEEMSPNYIWIMLPFLAIGFGVSFTTPAMTFAAIHSVAPKRAGIAAAVLNTGNQIGSLIGVAVFGTITITSKDFISGVHSTFYISGTLFMVTGFLSLFIMKEGVSTNFS